MKGIGLREYAINAHEERERARASEKLKELGEQQRKRQEVVTAAQKSLGEWLNQDLPNGTTFNVKLEGVYELGDNTNIEFTSRIPARVHFIVDEIFLVLEGFPWEDKRWKVYHPEQPNRPLKDIADLGKLLVEIKERKAIQKLSDEGVEI